ncbi:hypothetical protein CI238_12617, partial [Colletotrichum incanum]
LRASVFSLGTGRLGCGPSRGRANLGWRDPMQPRGLRQEFSEEFSAPLIHYPRVRFVSPLGESRLGCFSSRVNPGTLQATSRLSLRFFCKSRILARRGHEFSRPHAWGRADQDLTRQRRWRHTEEMTLASAGRPRCLGCDEAGEDKLRRLIMSLPFLSLVGS